MFKRYWIKSSITLYVFCVVGYNFFGKNTVAWTDFYYSMEKGMAFFSTMWGLNKQTLSDRLFIDFARIMQCGTWIFFILCSFHNSFWVYNQRVTMAILILASFGSVIVQHQLIKATRS